MPAPLQSNLLIAFPGSLRAVNEVEAVSDVEALFKDHPNVMAIDIYELHLVQTIRRPFDEKEIA